MSDIDEEKLAREAAEALRNKPELTPEQRRYAFEEMTTRRFEKHRSELEELIADSRAKLVADEDREEIRKIIMKKLAEFKIPHKYYQLTDDYKLVAPRNDRASHKIMECLAAGEEQDQILSCIFGTVFGVMATRDEEANVNTEAVPNDNIDELSKAVFAGSDKPNEQTDDDVVGLFEPDDDSDEPDVILLPEDDAEQSDPLEQQFASPTSGNTNAEVVGEEAEYTLANYLDDLAAEFVVKLEEIVVEDQSVLAPRPGYVNLRQARNGTWLISYDSVMGKKYNPEHGPADGRYQGPYNVVVADQERAAVTNEDDLEAIAQLILESVPRRFAEEGEPGQPYNYYVMTKANSDELKSDIADFLGLNRNSKLLGWLWRELLKGSDSARLAELYAEKQAEWAAKADEPPEPSLRDRRPDKQAKSPSKDVDDRSRTLAAVKAFMVEITKGLSPEEIESKRAEIKAKARALL